VAYTRAPPTRQAIFWIIFAAAARAAKKVSLLQLNGNMLVARAMKTAILLTLSNVFMTFAWYGHLKFKSAPLWIVIFISWGIALVEYCFQVPANRIGHGTFSAAQLKVMQEVITILVFSIFSVLYLKEGLKWNYLVGFALIIAAVFFVFKKW